MDLAQVNNLIMEQVQVQTKLHSRHGSFGSSVMTPVEASSATRDAPNENYPPPVLSSHPGQARLGHDKLAPRVDLERGVPVVLFDILDVADAASDTGIGHQDRNGLVFGGHA